MKKKFLVRINYLDLLTLFFILFLSVLPIYGIFKDTRYFPSHDIFKYTRTIITNNCFKNFQIPCRYSFYFGMGYGYPMFNFYHNFPYYLSGLISLFGIDFYDSVNLTYLFLSLFNAFFTYFTGKDLFKKNYYVIIFSVFSLIFPYLATMIYVKGTLGEFAAYSFFSPTLFFLYKISKLKYLDLKYLILLSFCLSFLILSHNVIGITFIFFAFLIFIYFLFLNNSYFTPKEYFFIIFFSLFNTVSLISFYLFPMMIDFNKVFLKAAITSDYFKFENHFLYLDQLFINDFFGYGFSFPERKDGMGFYLGFYHIIEILISTVIIILFFLKYFFIFPKKSFNSLLSNKLLTSLIFFTLLTWVMILQTTEASFFLYKLIFFLKFFQFPWRFLIYINYLIAFLAVFNFKFLEKILLRMMTKNKFKDFFLLNFCFIFSIIVTVNYYRYFKPYSYLKKLENYQMLEEIRTSKFGLFDYLPKCVEKLPLPNLTMNSLNENLKVISEFNYGIKKEFEFIVETKKREVVIPAFYYPGLKIILNNKEIDDLQLEKTPECFLKIKLNPGRYKLGVIFNEKRFFIFDLVSLFSLVINIILLMKANFFNKKIKFLKKVSN